MMPGKQKVYYAGLELEVNPVAEERGIYFTHEKPEFWLKIRNTTNKRIKSISQGGIIWFYGFGSGSPEARAYGPPITFDLEPGKTTEERIGGKLLGFQGNGVIAILTARQKDVIEKENNKERILKPPPPPRNFDTLYTFTIMEKEFYEQIYKRPITLTKIMTILTILIAILAGINIYLAAT